MNFRRKLAASLLSTALLTSGIVTAVPVQNAVYAASVDVTNPNQLAQKLRENYNLLTDDEKKLLQNSREFIEGKRTDLTWWKTTLQLQDFIAAAGTKGVSETEAVNFIVDFVEITYGLDANNAESKLAAFRSEHSPVFHKLTNYSLDELLSLVNDIQGNTKNVLKGNVLEILSLLGDASGLHTFVNNVIKDAVATTLNETSNQKFKGELNKLGLSLDQILGLNPDLENMKIDSTHTLGDARDIFLLAGSRQYLYANIDGGQISPIDSIEIDNVSVGKQLQLMMNVPQSLIPSLPPGVTSPMNMTKLVEWETTDASGNAQSGTITTNDETKTITIKPKATSAFLVAKSKAAVKEKQLTLAKFKLMIGQTQSLPSRTPGQDVPVPFNGGSITLPADLELPPGVTQLAVAEIPVGEITTPGIVPAGKILNFNFGQKVSFNVPVPIIIQYASNANPSKIAIFYYNEDTGKWEYQPSSEAKADGVHANVNHFSVYGVLQDNDGPTVPVVSSTSKTTNSITLSLNATDASGIKKYQAYQGSSLVAESTGGTLAITGLQPATTYNYKIIAFDNLNNPSNPNNISVTTENASTSSGGGGGGGGAATPAKPTAESVTDAQVDEAIKAAQNTNAKTVVINVSTKENIAFTPAQLKLITAAGKPLAIQLKQATFTFPVGALDVPEMSGASKIEFNAQALSASDSQNLAKEANNAAKVELAGQVYELDLTAVKSNNQTAKVALFKSPVQVAFKAPQDTVSNGTAGKLKVYRYDPDKKQWDTVGGAYNATAQTVTFETGHFSKYAMMLAKEDVVQPPVVQPPFADIKGHWAQKDIEFMATNGYVNGTGKGKFSPDKTITRAEFVAMLVNILKPTENKEMPFKDVPAGQWYTNSVKQAYAAGLVSGTSVNQFSPNKAVTREQMSAMIVNALKYKGIQPESVDINAVLNAFADKASISKWAQQSAAQAVKAGILNGQKKGNAVKFAPQSQATRAEAVVMLKNMLQK